MDETLKRDANRAFETAKLTTYWLYLAGIPEALEFGKHIGVDKMDASEIPFSEEMCFLNPIIHEIRYKSINYHIRKSGCKNVLDIACGYSPRGLKMSSEGFKYYGADLPVVAEEMKSVTTEMQLENCEYFGVDATNWPSLKKVSDSINGPVCVCMEGLEMYLTSTEVATVRKNIARILQEHPGSTFVTTDPGNGYLMANVVRSIYGLKEFMPTIQMLFKMYNWASDGGITMQTAKRSLTKDIKQFAEAGLKASRSRLLPQDSQLELTKRLHGKTLSKIVGVASKKFVFVSDLCEEKWLEEVCEPCEFQMTTNVEDEVLRMQLFGRVDTLSVPDILEHFEKYKESVRIVEIDMTDVTYLSSAGTRAIYLIGSELDGKDSLVLKGANSQIRESLLDDEVIERL